MLTYRFRSSFRTSGLTPTRLRNILAMMSSRIITISWLKNLILQGLVAICSFGILDRRRLVNEDRRGLRGRTEFSVTSNGPGTMTKCVVRVISGYDATTSASSSKFSRFAVR
jgi:hypothetical protein